MRKKLSIDKKVLLEVLNAYEHGVHIVDNQGNTMFYNDMAEKNDGLDKEKVYKTNLKEFVDSGVFSQSVALNILNKKKVIETVQYINGKSIFAKGIPLYNNGEIEAVVVFTKDTSSLQDVHRKLHYLLLENNDIEKIPADEREEYLGEDFIVSNSITMKNIVSYVEKISSFDTPVFIQGEQGVGKTVLAKYIHDLSDRSNKPFIKIDCSAIPPSIIDIELFGNFDNGNSISKIPILERANGGTLFMDNISDMPLSTQGRLFHVLNQNLVNKNDNRGDYIDVRIISASTENLQKLIIKGFFREDLFYLLNIVQLNMPSLRERKEDIIPLINLFLNKYNRRYGQKKFIDSKDIKLFTSYNWPGNVMELENVIQRLIFNSKDDKIDEDEICEIINPLVIELESGNTFREQIEFYEKKLILEYARKSSCIKELAYLAKINESTLRKKIERYKLHLNFD